MNSMGSLSTIAVFRWILTSEKVTHWTNCTASMLYKTWGVLATKTWYIYSQLWLNLYYELCVSEVQSLKWPAVGGGSIPPEICEVERRRLKQDTYKQLGGVDLKVGGGQRSHSLGHFFPAQKRFVCLKEAPKQTLCSLLTSGMLDVASNSMLKTSYTISGTLVADKRK